MLDKQHEKYCPLSKFENGLCGNSCNIIGHSVCHHDTDIAQTMTKWTVCPVPSKRVPVKDKFDEACEWLLDMFATNPTVTLIDSSGKELLRKFVERCK